MNIREAIDKLALGLTVAGVTQDHQTLVLAEEVGEAVQALFAYQGTNARKGVHGSVDQYREELADVVITALVAIRMTGVSPENVVADKLAKVMRNYSKVLDG